MMHTKGGRKSAYCMLRWPTGHRQQPKHYLRVSGGIKRYSDMLTQDRS